MFTPHGDRIEVKPFKKEQVILSQNENLIEVGEFIGGGDGYFKPGDIVHFLAYGCDKTEFNDEVHYLVDVKTILGYDRKE